MGAKIDYVRLISEVHVCVLDFVIERVGHIGEVQYKVSSSGKPAVKVDDSYP